MMLLSLRQFLVSCLLSVEDLHAIGRELMGEAVQPDEASSAAVTAALGVLQNIPAGKIRTLFLHVAYESDDGLEVYAQGVGSPYALTGAVLDMTAQLVEHQEKNQPKKFDAAQLAPSVSTKQ